MPPVQVLRLLSRAGLLCGVLQVAVASDVPTPPSAEEGDALYTMGLGIGQQLNQNGVAPAIPMTRIEQGIKDGLGGKRMLPADQVQLNAFLRASAEAAATRNANAARDFLARHAKETGVTTTASGLQYRVLSSGDTAAQSPQPTDLVTVSFRGTLLDGREFDSSSTPGSASMIQVNGVMKAWAEALTQMKPGARWQLWVSPDLGFGERSRPGVPGGSLLIYELQLVSVTPRVADTK